MITPEVQKVWRTEAVSIIGNPSEYPSQSVALANRVVALLDALADNGIYVGQSHVNEKDEEQDKLSRRVQQLERENTRLRLDYMNLKQTTYDQAHSAGANLGYNNCRSEWEPLVKEAKQQRDWLAEKMASELGSHATCSGIASKDSCSPEFWIDAAVQASRVNSAVLSVTEEKNGIAAFAEERKRQIIIKGFDAKHDADHHPDELRAAAICYATPAEQRDMVLANPFCSGQTEKYIPRLWPWEPDAWKPSTPQRDLEKAGALLAAAYDLEQSQKVGS